MKIGDIAAGAAGAGEVVGIENGTAVRVRLFAPRDRPWLTRTTVSMPSGECAVTQLKEEREAELDD